MSTSVTSITLSSFPPLVTGENVQKTIQLTKAVDGAPTASQTGVIKHLYQIIKGPNGKVQVEGVIPASKVPLRVASPSPAVFSVGDKVKYLSQFAKAKALSHLPSEGLDETGKKVMAAVGTVQSVFGPVVVVDFQGLDGKFCSCVSTTLQKLNKYSINELVKIRNDAPTIQKLKGLIGRVIKIDEKDPSTKVFVRFDDAEIHQWLPKDVSLPSAWMDPFQTAHPATEKELLELFSLELSLFFKAVNEGDLRTAKILYNRHQPGVDAEARNSDGRTALHVASRKGHIDLVVWLLKDAKVDVDTPDRKGFRAIHYAVLGCQLKVLEMLLGKGANVDSQTNCGKTALHVAVILNLTDFLVPLKEFNADANLQDSEGNTPLHVALWNGNYHLLDKMMRIFYFKWDLQNKKGFNVLHLAVIKNHLSAVKFITAKESMMCGRLLDTMPIRGSTVLHYACTHKNYPLVKLLLDESKDWITRDKLQLLGKLLEARDESGMTALLIACRCQDYGAVELLVEAGADVNATDQDGNTAIILAASNQDQKILIPSKGQSPTICRIYEDALTDTEAAKELMVQNLPILSLISYLVANGATLAGKKGVNLVIKKGSAELVIELITRLASKVPVRDPFGGMNCMGRSDCNQPPVHLISCLHKPACNACHQCFLLYSSQMKCGCPEEDVEPIPSVSPPKLLDLSWDREEETTKLEEIEPDLLNYDMSLFQDEVVVAGEDGTAMIHPQLSCNNPDVLKRKLDKEENKIEGPSVPKKGRRDK